MGKKKIFTEDQEITHANWFDQKLPPLDLPSVIKINPEQKTIKAALMYDKAKIVYETQVQEYENKSICRNILV
jgi:hypothetical protein